MDKHPMKDAFDNLLTNIKELVSSDTIIGDPIETGDGTRIIPVSRAVFGFASGGAEFDSKLTPENPHFGGGSGAGLTVTPVCFLVIKNGEVKLLQVPNGVSEAERIVAQMPDVIEKITDIFRKDKDENDY